MEGEFNCYNDTKLFSVLNNDNNTMPWFYVDFIRS